LIYLTVFTNFLNRGAKYNGSVVQGHIKDTMWRWTDIDLHINNQYHTDNYERCRPRCRRTALLRCTWL